VAALIDWFARLTVYGWTGLGLLLALVVIGVALVWDDERLLKRVVTVEAGWPRLNPGSSPLRASFAHRITTVGVNRTLSLRESRPW
jgi:hypothetical protein